ncbi:MAG TPA: aldehyde ferredoxin oxidoreductase C-terminal domain-containing protein [Smithellaceae bacterium]|nr:aldehyde ferredoxin oxidoreductase C-terminal domain-containing protein [Smithellaceae bacterium]
MKKILRIDLSNRQYGFEDINSVYAGLGGRGFTSKVVSEEVSPKTDPLGMANKLVFAPGILAGTAAPNNGRLSVGAKSPLTGGIKEANAGGAAAQKIARLGIRGIVVEGFSSSLTMAKVTKDGVEFIPADEFKGMGNYEIIDRLRAGHGDGISVISIGPGGEKLVKAAGISVTSPDFKIRMAARGGLGAVMGSKNLKALIIDDAGMKGVEVADAAALKKAAADLTKGILSHPLTAGFRALGTPLLVNMINGSGCLPTRNYSMGQFKDAEKISGEYMAESQAARPNSQASHRCMKGCIVSCSNVYTDENGEEIVSGLEYETLGLVGSNCLISDLDEIAVINRLCNDLGLDTMEVGTALAVAMEAGLIPWGDGKTARALIEEAWKGTQKSLMIANGCLATGKTLGVKRIPAVKGQSVAAYDPRVLKGTGVTYATSPMGADHTCGNALPSPANPDYNPAASTGQGPVSASLQIFHAAIDSLGLCLFAAVPLLDIPDLMKPLIACAAAVTGEMPDENYLVNLGISVLKAEKQFNELAGFTASDDRLPEFFTKEPLLPSGLVYDVPEAELDAVLPF